jgi:hypothetical protein
VNFRHVHASTLKCLEEAYLFTLRPKETVISDFEKSCGRVESDIAILALINCMEAFTGRDREFRQ